MECALTPAPTSCTSTMLAFTNKIVAITGVTGFVGSIVLRDILRLCQSATHIYALIRPWKGMSANARLLELFQKPLFDEIKDKTPEVLRLVSAVEWDMATGLTPLPLNVNVVIHCASANIHEGLTMKKVVETNYGGLRRLTDAAQKSHATVVYLSSTSALENLCGDCAVEEVVYPLESNHECLYQQLTTLGPLKARRILAEHGFADAHALSFRMCELLMEDFHTRASLSSFRRMQSYRNMSRDVGCQGQCSFGGAVVRASDVAGMIGGGALRGYVSSSSSVSTAGILAIGSGRLRRSSLKPTDVLSLIPGDQVASLLVGVATWLISRDSSNALALNKSVRTGDLARAMDFAHADPFCVFHACTSGSPSPLTFGRFSRTVLECFENNKSHRSPSEGPEQPILRPFPEKEGDPGCFGRLKRLRYKCAIAASSVFCSSARTVDLRNRARVDEQLCQGLTGHGLNRRYEVKNTYGLQLLLNQADRKLPRSCAAATDDDGGKWCFILPMNADDWHPYLKSFCNGAVSAARRRLRSSSWAKNAIDRCRSMSSVRRRQSVRQKATQRNRAATSLERGRTFRFHEFFPPQPPPPECSVAEGASPPSKDPVLCDIALDEIGVEVACNPVGAVPQVQTLKIQSSQRIGKVVIRTDEMISPQSRGDLQTKPTCFVVTSSYRDSPDSSGSSRPMAPMTGARSLTSLKQSSDKFNVVAVMPLLGEDLAAIKLFRTYASAA